MTTPRTPLSLRRHGWLATLAGILLSSSVVQADPGGASGITELGATDANGLFPPQLCYAPSLSADGRYLAFTCAAALLPADPNAATDVYVIDRTTGVLTCASCTPAGIYGNDSSFSPSISGDGRWVVFMTDATNFAPLDGNGDLDIYRKDLQTNALERVSNAHLSPAAANAGSTFPSISDDGRYVAFSSYASDLVALDTNGLLDVFVRDMQMGSTQRVSVGVWGQSNGGSTYPAISGDGLHVAFSSAASNLVLFDTNNNSDVFVVELGSLPALVSRGMGGAPANGNSTQPDISYDGARVCFQSTATNLVNWDINGVSDVYAVDVDTLTVERASLTSLQLQQGTSATAAKISRDGNLIAFTSTAAFAPFGAAGFSNVYVRNLTTDETWTASRPSGTVALATGNSLVPDLALGGSLVAFSSSAPDMVPGDPNGAYDVFVRTMHADPYAYCTGSTTFASCQPTLTSTGFPSVSSGEFFALEGDELPNGKLGLLFYGFGGQALIPFAGATLCVAPPLARSPLIATNGNPPAVDDCSGFYAYDMNGFALGLYGGQPRPELSIVGQRVNIQFWGRDPLGPSGTFLTNALEYIVGP